MTDQRAERERAFHDAMFVTDVRERTSKYYAAVDHLFTTYAERVRVDAGDRRVLELGCGKGGQAFGLAELGDDVLAIDISPVAVEITQAEAEARGVTLAAVQMNAHALDVESDSLDLVCGSGILHHLDLPRALSEVARVLRPSGQACFIEPLGHNPVINAYRRRTPSLRSEDERPLRRGDIARVESRFEVVRKSFAGLLTLPLALHRSTRSGALMRFAGRVESKYLRQTVPGLAAWFVLLECSYPLSIGGTAAPAPPSPR